MHHIPSKSRRPFTTQDWHMFQPSKTNNLSLRKEHPQLLLIKSLDNIELVGRDKVDFWNIYLHGIFVLEKEK